MCLYHPEKVSVQHQPINQCTRKIVKILNTNCKLSVEYKLHTWKQLVHYYQGVGNFEIISQLIRYARASSNYSDFLKRHLHLRNRLLDQGYKKIRLIRSLKKFIFQYQDLVEIYSVSAEKIINDGFSYSENA